MTNRHCTCHLKTHLDLNSLGGVCACVNNQELFSPFLCLIYCWARFHGNISVFLLLGHCVVTSLGTGVL